MDFNWEPFTEIKASFAARVTVRQTGQLGFTRGALNSYEILKKEFAYLFFDQHRRAVGIRLSNDNGKGAIPINKKNPSNVHLRAKNFCDKYSITTDKARRYELKEDKKSGILYFLLDDGEDDLENNLESETEQDVRNDGIENN